MAVTRQQPESSRYFLWFAGLLLAVATPVNGNEQDRLQRFLRDVQTFSADFEQIQVSEFGEELDAASGDFKLFKPGRFYWHYKTPYLQRIISNGEVVWIYDEDLEQVTINNAAVSIDDAPTLIINGDADINQYYDVQQFILEDGRAVYELLSRNEDAQYRKVLFTFLADTLESMTLHDALGQTTRISFSNAVRNPGLDPGLFDFTAPDDVDVIDNRQDVPPPPTLE